MAARADGRDVEDLLRLDVRTHLVVRHRDLRATTGHAARYVGGPSGAEAGTAAAAPVTSGWDAPARAPSGTRRRAPRRLSGRRRPGGPDDCRRTDRAAPARLLRPTARAPSTRRSVMQREQVGREPAAAAGDEPHGHLAAVRRRTRAHATAAAASTSDRRARPLPSPRRGRRRLRERRHAMPADGTSSASTSDRCSRRTNDVLWSSASTTSTRMSPRRMTASPTRSGQPTTHTVASAGSRSTRWSGVGSFSTSRGERDGCTERIAGREQRRAEPPQRTRRRVALDDPAARDDESGRLELQPADRPCSLVDEHPLIAARSPRDVPKSLDRVHTATLQRASAGTSGGAATDGPPGGGACEATHGMSGDREATSVAERSACYRLAVATAPSPDIVLTPLDGDAASARGVADDVPPGEHRARPVHQRERMDPADGGAGHERRCAAATRASTSSSPATASEARTLPRAARRRLPRLPRSGPCAREGARAADAPGVRVPALRRHRAGGGRGMGPRRVARRSPT